MRTRRKATKTTRTLIVEGERTNLRLQLDEGDRFKVQFDGSKGTWLGSLQGWFERIPGPEQRCIQKMVNRVMAKKA